MRLSLTAYGILGSMLAIAGLLVWVFSLRADKAALNAALANRDGVIVTQNRQLRTAALTISLKDLEIELNDRNVKAGDTAVVAGKKAGKDIAAPLHQGVKTYAPDADPVAGPPLNDAVERLRDFAAKLRSLRAALSGETAGVSGAAHSAGAAGDTWPRLKPGFRESEFRDACFQLGDGFADLAGKVFGIGAFQAQYNANIRAANAAAAAEVVGK